MERDKKFPFGRLIWAAVVGGATTAGSAFYPQEYWNFFILGFFCPIIFFLGTCIYCVFKR